LPQQNLPDDERAFGCFLSGLLQKASQSLDPGHTLTVVVDALDEAEDWNRSREQNLLALPPVLPPNVYIVLTTRRGWQSRLRIEQSEVFHLTGDLRENLEDIEEHLRARARSRRLANWRRKQKLSMSEFVAGMLAKSAGNFMYLSYVLPEIESGNYADLTIKRLPVGLENYYEDHWRRMGMAAKPGSQLKIKVIYTLSVVREPVSRSLLADFCREAEATVQDVLDEWKQFLSTSGEGTGRRYSVYHASFRDFLHRKDIVQAAGADLKGIRVAIPTKFMSEIFGA